MSSIRIVKGLPISVVVRLKSDDTLIDVNDGTWTVTVDLCYQTDDGPSPFSITSSPYDVGVIIELTGDQTSQLNHLGTGYLLCVSCTKDDGLVFIKNSIPVTVTSGV